MTGGRRAGAPANAGGTGGTADTGGSGGGTSTLGDPLTNLLGSVLQGNGLNRPAPGGTSQADEMWADFDAAYNTDMVSLYAGPLLTSTTRTGGAR